MSTLHCGRAVPAALRRFRPLRAETLCRQPRTLPTELPEGLHLVLPTPERTHSTGTWQARATVYLYYQTLSEDKSMFLTIHGYL